MANTTVSRRQALVGVGVGTVSGRQLREAGAQGQSGYKRLVDRIEGYELQYPADWLKVNTAGSAACYRNPSRPDEIFYVEISSPKGYQLSNLAELGTPQDALKRFVDQYQYEFMSTRLGISREVTPIGVTSRTADDGNQFYDLSLSVSSYASENQLAINPENRPQKLEFSRRALATWCTRNGRLYELRLQISEKDYDRERETLEAVQNSFSPFTVDT